MVKPILIDEIQFTLFAPPDLQNKSFRAIRRTLRSARFHAALRRAVHGLLARYPSLGKVTFTFTR